jgi:lipid-A-disaccharide synthase-like uncharacterized protein
VLQAWWTKLADLDLWTLFWLTFGFAAQSFFAARFVWQWLASEKKGRSTVPLGFWILSLLGGGMLLVYACHLKDPVFIAGQGLGLFIYVRNLMLIRQRREAVRRRHPALRQRQVGFAVSPSDPDRELPQAPRSD